MMSASVDFRDDDKIIRMPDLDFEPDPKGLGHAFFQSMSKYKENVAQIDGVTGEKDTYTSLLQRCIRTALRMRERGVTNDDIVASCSFTHLNSCVPFFATLFLGVKTVGIDPTLSTNETVHLLKQVTPKLIFVTPEALELIENVVKQVNPDIQIVVFGNSTKYTSFDRFLLPHTEEFDFKPYEATNLRETALIFFSSGTTGLPKGICIDHFSFLTQLMITINIGYCQDVTMSFSSLYWITPTLFLGTTVLCGHARLLVPKFHVDTIWKAITNYKPTFIVAIPFHFLSMYNEGRPEYADTSSVKHIGIGGGHLIPKQISSIRTIFPDTKFFPGYGQTEMAMLITCFKPCNSDDYLISLKKPTSCGTGIQGMWYKVVNLETEEVLGPNQHGELYLKSDYRLNGYYNQDSSHVWDTEGWYKTGDVVYYDEDRCFYVVDRVKELLKYQSWHVPPALLEGILLEHPDVANAIVIGLPDEVDENHPLALVILKDTAKNITAHDLQRYVDEQVDDRKKLRGGVKIIKEIPSAATGKVRRRVIRDMYLRGEI